MPIPNGITRQDALDAIAHLALNPNHGFGDSTKYDLVHEGKRYPPKAVVGYAARRVLAGEILHNTEFSGGDSQGAANHLLRSLGFSIEPKDQGLPTMALLPEDVHIRATLDSLVEAWRESGTNEPFATSHAWTSNRQYLEDALSRLEATSDLASFTGALASIPNPPSWYKKGSHKTFLGTIANRPADPQAAAVVADALRAPADEGDAAVKIARLEALAESAQPIYPGPGFAPLAASIHWGFQDPDNWPWLSVEAESALQNLRLLPKTSSPTDRYLRFRQLIRSSSASAPETAHALAKASIGTTSLSPAIYARLSENADLLIGWYDSGSQYQSDEDRDRAERNINAVLGELDLLAKGMNEHVADKLVRPLVTSKTESTVGFDTGAPSRADAYAIFTLEKNMTKPSIRVWGTRSGLAIGADFGARKYDEAAPLARGLLGDLPSELQFFEVRPHRSGDRLRPAGHQPQRGELFIGQWFAGGLTGPGLGAEVIRTVALLQSTFDAMVTAAGQAPPAPVSGDPLSALVEEFRTASGYPTDADTTDIAERGKMAEVISADGLLAFDPPQFRRIFNTSRYGSPGPQSSLNSSLTQMSAEQLDQFAQNIEYLLRGDDPVEQRINVLMDQSGKGVKGLGEAVITKLLAIEHPNRFMPLFVYRGPKGKARMLSLLDIQQEGLDSLDAGSRAVRSNDLIRDRLAPFLPDDTYGMSRFLYWLSGRPETDQPIDETDRIGNLADELLIDADFIREVVGLLESKGQVIFYGPPGTGKTYVARELAKALAPDPAHRMVIQFHPSTSYEDFFEGYRPETDAQGNLTYRLIKGPLAMMAEQAKDNPSQTFVMVIDEFNRANLPKVLGELLYLLEYREESIRSLYRPDEPFELPKKILIIGTMNTADRSIALVDAALRRRFHFIPFFPHEEPLGGLLRRWLQHHAEPTWVADLLDSVNDDLRVRLAGPHLQIGPSHFMRSNLTEPILEQIWKYSIMPFVEDQLYGDEAGIKEYEFARVVKRLRAKTGIENSEEGDVGSDPAPGVE